MSSIAYLLAFPLTIENQNIDVSVLNFSELEQNISVVEF